MIKKLIILLKKTYKIIVFTIFVWNKDSKIRFFKKNFLFLNIYLDIL